MGWLLGCGLASRFAGRSPSCDRLRQRHSGGPTPPFPRASNTPRRSSLPPSVQPPAFSLCRRRRRCRTGCQWPGRSRGSAARTESPAAACRPLACRCSLAVADGWRWRASADGRMAGSQHGFRGQALAQQVTLAFDRALPTWSRRVQSAPDRRTIGPSTPRRPY